MLALNCIVSQANCVDDGLNWSGLASNSLMLKDNGFVWLVLACNCNADVQPSFFFFYLTVYLFKNVKLRSHKASYVLS